MDASNIPSGKRYVLLETELADIIEDINTDDLRLLIDLLTTPASHTTITTPGGKRLHLVGRLRRTSGEFM